MPTIFKLGQCFLKRRFLLCIKLKPLKNFERGTTYRSYPINVMKFQQMVLKMSILQLLLTYRCGIASSPDLLITHLQVSQKIHNLVQ